MSTSSGMGGTKSSNHVQITKELYEYVLKMGTKQSEGLKQIHDLTMNHPRARMMGSPDEARMFQVLLKLMGAKRVIEVGVFTGYTTLAMAEVLGDDGVIEALDVTDEYLQVGRPVWESTGQSSKIHVHIAPASESLQKLIDAGGPKYDFAFVDADKVNYPVYYEQLLQLVRPNGLIAVDNVIWHGAVIDPAQQDEDTQAIRRVNEIIAADPRVDIVMLAIADGVTLARVK